MTSGFHFEIDPKSVQRIIPPNSSERFEGVDFSRSGDVLAIATSETNKVMLFRRKRDGQFEDTPFRTIGCPKRRSFATHLAQGFDEIELAIPVTLRASAPGGDLLPRCQRRALCRPGVLLPGNQRAHRLAIKAELWQNLSCTSGGD
jgi:hypothetical protein